MVTMSTDMIVACEIYRLTEVEKRRVWFTKLVESLSGKMSMNDVSNALDTLTDWGIIGGEYGRTENGRAGYLYYIDMERSGGKIKEVYEKYYMDESRATLEGV